MKVTKNSPLAQYGLAVLCVVVAVFIRWMLTPLIGNRYIFVTFFTAVMVTAYFGGLKPGLLATLLSVLAANYLYLPPENALASAAPDHWVGLLVAVFNMVVISVLSEALHRSRRKAADSARRAIEQEHRYRTMVETAAEGVWIVDTDERTTFVNPRLTEMFGYNADEMLGFRPYDFIFEEDQKAAHERLRQRREGDNRPRDFRYRCKDGSALWATVTTSVLRGAQGEFIGLLALLTDIKDRKRDEAEREALLRREQEARQLAENANRMKDEFLATLSHEMRTPLNAIMGWSQMLKQRQLDEDAAEQAIEVIYRNAKAQAQIVEDLLDVSRIITGKLTLNLQPIQIEKIVDAALDAVRPMAEAKQVAISRRVAAQPAVIGDPMRLQQAVLNLLTNAVKFTPRGGHVETLIEADERAARIVVKDDGQGIRADFLPFIFERFRQADSSYTRKYTGLGLGLAIARHLVQSHDGEIAAFSAGEGFGSTFTITLPLALAHLVPVASPIQQATASNATDDSIPPLIGIKVLVVDDDADTREVLRAILSLKGAEVSLAGGAAEAVALVQRWRPDVLLSDIGMPDEDGYALIRTVRGLATEAGGNVHAVALTGYASDEESERARQAGFQAHYTKPVDAERLIETIARLAGVGDKVRGA